MENHATDQLHSKMGHVQVAAARLPGEGKGLRKRRLQGVGKAQAVRGVVALDSFEPLLDFGLELRHSFLKLGVAEALDLRLEGIDGRDDRGHALDVALVLSADKPRDTFVNNLVYLHGSFQGSIRNPAWSARRGL